MVYTPETFDRRRIDISENTFVNLEFITIMFPER